MNMSNEERNRIIRERARQAGDNLEGFVTHIEIKPKPPSWFAVAWYTVAGAAIQVVGFFGVWRWFGELRVSQTTWEGVAALIAMMFFVLVFVLGFVWFGKGGELLGKRKRRNR